MSGGLLAALPVAPAAPGIAITGALILAAFAWVVLWGTMQGYDYSFGALVRKLADMVEDIWVVGGTLADALNGLDTFVLRQMGRGLDGLEEANARLWDALSWVVRETADAMVAFGSDVADAIGGLVGGTIPTQIGNVVRPVRDDLAGLRRKLRGIRETELARFRNGIDGLRRDLTREALRSERGIDYLAGRLDGVVMPGIRALDQRLDQVIGYTRRTLARRLSTVEKLVLGGAITAAAVAALTRYFPYWQCTNVRRFNRGLCRSPIGSLDFLFALLGFSVVALDPEQVAQFAQDLTDELGGIIEQMAG